MVQGQRKVQLTADLILSKVEDYDIYRYYIGADFTTRGKMVSPFRRDPNPSFSVFYTKKGRLYHTDFGDMTYKGTCIDFVMQLFGIGYSQALEKINQDLCLGIQHEQFKKIIVGNPASISPKKYCIVKIVSKRFNKKELEFWNQYHITEEELKQNQIFSVREMTKDGSRVLFGEKEMVFGYRYDDRWKIYRPFAEKRENKWYPNNVPIDKMDGLDCLQKGKPCIITKSRKDWIVLRKIYPHVCAVQNESHVSINEKNLEYIKENSSIQYINFDNDAPGKKASQFFTDTYGFKHVNVPDYYAVQGIKDFADMAKFLGLEAVENYLKHKKII